MYVKTVDPLLSRYNGLCGGVFHHVEVSLPLFKSVKYVISGSRFG